MLGIVIWALFSEKTKGTPVRRSNWNLSSYFVTLAGAALLATLIMHTGFEQRLRKAAAEYAKRQQSAQERAGHPAGKNVRNARIRWDEVAIVVVLLGGTLSNRLFSSFSSCMLAQTSDEPVRITEPVKVVKKVDPIYPRTAQDKGIQGRVVVDATVGPDGKVRNMQVVEGDETLADAFKSALKKWRFEPQARDGKLISFITRLAMTFANDQPSMHQTRVTDPSADPKVVKSGPGCGIWKPYQ